MTRGSCFFIASSTLFLFEHAACILFLYMKLSVLILPCKKYVCVYIYTNIDMMFHRVFVSSWNQIGLIYDSFSFGACWTILMRTTGAFCKNTERKGSPSRHLCCSTKTAALCWNTYPSIPFKNLHHFLCCQLKLLSTLYSSLLLLCLVNKIKPGKLGF